MIEAMDLQEPDWFTVVGGPPPGEVVVRDVAVGLLILLGFLVAGLALPMVSRLAMIVSGAATAMGVVMALRRSWRRSQRVRVYGNVLEHQDGDRVVRVVLNRAVLSTAMAPPSMLVLMLDDGRGHVTVARRAEAQEVADLPPCLLSFLELRAEHFEEIRLAAQRSYPQA